VEIVMKKKQPGEVSAMPGKAAEPGRLGVDDRGNITWEWASEVDQLADDAPGNAERVQALVDRAMKIQDELDDPLQAFAPGSPKGLKTGYDPYDSGELGKQSYRKKKNLRELSKWIALRKKMAERKDDE
jgi:hypothetical protein